MPTERWRLWRIAIWFSIHGRQRSVYYSLKCDRTGFGQPRIQINFIHLNCRGNGGRGGLTLIDRGQAAIKLKLMTLLESSLVSNPQRQDIMDDNEFPPRVQKGAHVPPVKLYPDKFEDHVVIVTGAAQGIGKTTATLFAQQGATVILVDIDTARLATLREELKSQGFKAFQHAADITQESTVRTLVKDVITAHGKIDVLVHLAGIYPFIPIAQATLEDFTRIMDVNMTSTFFLTQAVLPHMQQAGYGRIINTSTAAILSPSAGMSIYTAAKGAVTAFTRAIATEAGPGVTVNAVCPSMIFTESTWSNPGARGVAGAVLDRQHVKRVGLPLDVAYMVCFIASPESEWITGQLFNVAGGAVFT